MDQSKPLPNAMSITFKKFTASARLSEETTAYDAQVFFEGTHIGYSRNSGRGEMGHFYTTEGVDPQVVARAQAWVESQVVTGFLDEPLVIDGKTIRFQHIGEYCDHLADETLDNRQTASLVKRSLKTHILFIDPDHGPGVLKIKQAWRPELEPQVKKRHPKAIILNTMSVDEAIAAFKDEQKRQMAQEMSQEMSQDKPRGMKP